MENTQDWVLQSISISQDWQKPGLYTGSCKFKNGVKIEVALLLDNTKCAQMVDLLRDEIVSSSETIGELIVKAMPKALPKPNDEPINS